MPVSRPPDQELVVSREALGALVHQFVERRLRGERSPVATLLGCSPIGDEALDEILEVLRALDELASREDSTGQADGRRG